ncbi:OmpH family outer membrane protein [Roseivirga echinicomitans]|uniref:OmpH family outer membrane protein n=1 Tax=Roseivirga echinicomitans TaxID=296218 RepID=UPI000B12F2E7|nr:OmpH family outer membrane protein [Roseivirga echinicomitans]
MHKFSPAIVLFFVISNFVLAQNEAYAQKFGHIDSGYILSKMPEYAEKKKEIEDLHKEYDKVVRSLQNQAEKMRAELRAKEILFTPEMIKEKQNEIDLKEQEALDKSTELFGYDGLIYKKQNELLRPLWQKMSEATEIVSRKHKIDYMLDKAADVSIIYSNPEHDYTEFVLEELELLKKKN